ncbi:MAG: Tfp pilus assembly protein FimT/FimU [Thermodesulfobacteriota bacterium]
MTRMWRAGTSTDRGGWRGGFTLIELIVVIAILASVLIIAFPAMKTLEGYGFRSDARKMAGLIRSLDDSATAEGRYYRFWFYVEDESFMVESSSDGEEFSPVADPDIRGFKLGRATEIEDIVISGLGRISSGEAAVIFNPSAGADPFSLHLQQGELQLTLSYNPYSGKVKIIQGYV